MLQEYADTYQYDPTNDFDKINTALGEKGSIVTAVNGVSNIISQHFDQQLKDTEDAEKVIKLISGIGQVDYDGEGKKRLDVATDAYESLSPGAKRIVDSTSINGFNTLNDKHKEWKNEERNHYAQLRAQEDARIRGEVEEENRIKKEQEALQDKQIAVLTDAIKRTYGASAVDYATNIKNASPAEIEIANAIKRRGLSRGDSFDSPNNAAIQKITEMINTSGLGVNINPTADALWKYMQDIGFSHGGIADTLQKIPAINGDDGWITVKRGEAVLTPEQTKAFHTLAGNLDILNPSVDTLTNISKLNTSIFPKNHITTTSVGDVYLNVELPNITNYEEFRQKLQSDPKIEKMFKSIIWDKNNLSKYNIKM